MATCIVCKMDEGSAETGVCEKCAATLAIQALPESRRPAVACTRCHGMRFIRCIPREQTVEQRSSDFVQSVVRPMTVTQLMGVASGWWKDYAVPLGTGAGVLEMYVCTKCGFVEWYCQDPEKVPIAPEFNTQIVDYSPDSPYRG